MDNVLSTLGLMYRANKILLGEDILDNMNRVLFLFIASDASDKTKERLLKKCHFYNIDYCIKYNSEELSKSLGKNNIKTIGLIDEGFTKSIKNKLGGNYGKANLQETFK